mgnify:CR=1 FL=1
MEVRRVELAVFLGGNRLSLRNDQLLLPLLAVLGLLQTVRLDRFAGERRRALFALLLKH